MGEFDKLLLVADIDNTSIEIFGAISKENLDAINYFRANGGLFTFATGRLPNSAMHYFAAADIKTPVICGNGSVIYSYTEDKVIYERRLGGDFKGIIEAAHNAVPNLGVEIYKDGIVYVTARNAWLDEHNKFGMLNIVYTTLDEAPDDWMKINFIIDPKNMKRLKDGLKNFGYGTNCEIVNSSEAFLEILPKGATKGTALVKLAELVGVEMRNTIAVGDNENDIDMIETVGYGIAVENATEAVRRAAKYHACHCRNHAIAHVVSMISKGEIPCVKR